MLQFKDNYLKPVEAPWYSSWFNQELYDEVYTHRTSSEAQIAVKLLENLIYPYFKNLTGDYILDIGCGNCRHINYLSKLSSNLIGLDLSYRQLKNGHKHLIESGANYSQKLIRADMKFLPVKENSLALITNFFTSFGYFSCDSEHQETLNNWSSSLQRNGLLFIDLFNRNHILDNLTPMTYSSVNGYTIKQQRKVSSDRKRIEKLITINSKFGNNFFKESVRLFSLEELSKMLLISGLRINEIKGSYLGADYTSNSERLIILAQKI